MEDLRERQRKRIHEELRSQYLDTLTYKDIRNNFEVRYPRCVSNKSQCKVYTICRPTQLSAGWYANLLNVSLNYMFRPQRLAIIRLYKRKLIN